MKVFIEQSGEKNKKNVFDKKTGKISKTVNFHLTYPYPYGYILDTKSDDGENLDCYVITKKKLGTCSVVEANPIGMAEFFEDGQADHKILVVLKDENYKIDNEVKKKLTYFSDHFFDNRPAKKFFNGKFLGKTEAEKLINKTSIFTYKNYSPKYEKLFEKIKNKILKLSKKKLEIEHIGSTAVKNLGGKGIIDISIGIKKWDEADKILKILKKLGFKHFHPIENGDLFASTKAQCDEGDYHVHISLVDSKKYKEVIAFRNFLRRHPAEAKKYARLKKEILKKCDGNRKQYKKLKNKYFLDFSSKK